MHVLRWTVPAAASAVLLIGCTSTTSDPMREDTPSTSSSIAPTGSDPDMTTIDPDASTRVRIDVDGQVFDATVRDSPAGRALVDQLPLALELTDFGGQEKIATLPHPLPMDDMPAGDDPEPLDLGYYAPGGVLVLYYADVGYYSGIARLGRIDATAADLIAIPDGATATLDLAPDADG